MNKRCIHLMASVLPLLYTLPALAQEHEGAKTLPQLEVGTYPNVLFWMAVTFVLLLVFMQLAGIPGVHKTIAKRRNILDTDLGAARQASHEAQAVIQAYETELFEARRKAHETVAGFMAEAAKESAERSEKQQEEMSHRMIVAQENMAEAKQQAMTETQRYVNDLVQEVVNRVLNSGIETQKIKAVK